jgi:hypothetical protein
MRCLSFAGQGNVRQPLPVVSTAIPTGVQLNTNPRPDRFGPHPQGRPNDNRFIRAEERLMFLLELTKAG